MVDFWTPVGSGYVTRTAQIVSGQRQLGVSIPSLLVSSRQFVHGTQAGAPLEGVPVHQVNPSALERWTRKLHRWHVDSRSLAREIVAIGAEHDIIHVHGASGLGSAAAAAARTLGKPLVAEIRYDLAGAFLSESFGTSNVFLEDLLRKKFLSHLREAAVIVAASEALASLLRAKGYGAPGVAVVPNGVDPKLFTEAACRSDDANRADKLRGASGPKIVVGSTSHLLDYEGLDLLIGAMAGLERVSLLLVGDGAARDALRKKAQACNVELTILDRVPYAEVPSLLRRIDVFAIPRRDRTITRYASPIKLIEAMAAGRAIVAFDVGDIAAHLEDGRGLIAPAGDLAALRKLIVQLRDDAVLRQSLGAAARRYVVDHRQWRDVIPTYAGVYRQAVSR